MRITSYLLFAISFAILPSCSTEPKVELSPGPREETEYGSVIGERLKAIWLPTVELKRKFAKEQGLLFDNSRKRVTEVSFLIGLTGDVKTVEVLSPSGIQLVDEAAIDSIRQISPLPPPPVALLKDEKVRWKWRFVIEPN